MPEYAIYRKKFVSLCLHPMIWVLLILLTAGCGDNSTSPTAGENTTADASRTGSAIFSVQWQPDNAVSASADSIIRSAIACDAVGIATITCNVYDENNDLVTSSDTWQCADGGATMDRIPEGSNLTFAIFGWDEEDGNIIYQGTSEKPVTIIAGETANAGTIKANPFIPTGLGANAVTTSQIDLIWNDMGASSYRIYQDGVITATPTSPSFRIIGLTPNTQYCYTVSAVDIYGNESGQCIQDCATTGAVNDTQAPTVPAALSAAATSVSQIDINWEESIDDIGVAGYRIYHDDQLVDTATTPPYSHEGLQDDTEYCYTVEAFDATGNTSAQSAPACATTEVFIDTEPPTQPDGLQAVAVTANQIDLSWTASTDNVVVSIYWVYRDGEIVGETSTTTYSDEPIQPEVEYCYTVEAYDAANNVSPRSADACATPEAIINVNIDDEFQYVDQGSPMGLSPGETAGKDLSYEPFEVNLIEPPYSDLYMQYTVRYGYLLMGNSQDNLISFAIVENYSSTGLSRYELFIDSNNNENLTDDGGPYINQGTTDFAVEVPLRADIITDNGSRITRPYQLWLRVIDNSLVRFYATCHYTGEIRIGGQTFTAVAFERFNHDALYRENGLSIDLDHNGEIDVELEYFQYQDMVTVGGQPYELLLNYP